MSLTNNKILMLISAFCISFIPLTTTDVLANKKDVSYSVDERHKKSVIPNKNNKQAHYDIKVRYLHDKRKLEGKINIALDATQLEAQDDSLYLDLHIANMSLNSDVIANRVINVDNIKVNNQLIKNTEIHNRILKISLAGIDRSAGLTINMDYNLIIPTKGIEFLSHNTAGEALLYTWYPRILVRDDNGWAFPQKDDNYVNGDYSYMRTSDFDVELDLSPDYEIVSTGMVEDLGNNKYKIKQTNVRDFVALIFPKGIYKKFSDKIAVSDNKYINVNIMHKSDKIADADVLKLLETAKKSLGFFGQIIGEYPYQDFDIILTDNPDYFAGGMELPGFVVVKFLHDKNTNDGNPIQNSQDSMNSTIVHEVAHQWFYGIVGNNPRTEAWLDEGIATFLTNLYSAENNSSANNGITAAQINLNGAESHYDSVYRDSGHSTLDKSHKIFLPYYDLLYYDRMSDMWMELSGMLGVDKFKLFLKKYYEKYKYKLVTHNDFSVMVKDTLKDHLQKQGLSVKEADSQIRYFFTKYFYANISDFNSKENAIKFNDYDEKEVFSTNYLYDLFKQNNGKAKNHEVSKINYIKEVEPVQRDNVFLYDFPIQLTDDKYLKFEVSSKEHLQKEIWPYIHRLMEEITNSARFFYNKIGYDPTSLSLKINIHDSGVRLSFLNQATTIEKNIDLPKQEFENLLKEDNLYKFTNNVFMVFLVHESQKNLTDQTKAMDNGDQNNPHFLMRGLVLIISQMYLSQEKPMMNWLDYFHYNNKYWSINEIRKLNADLLSPLSPVVSDLNDSLSISLSFMLADLFSQVDKSERFVEMIKGFLVKYNYSPKHPFDLFNMMSSLFSDYLIKDRHMKPAEAQAKVKAYWQKWLPNLTSKEVNISHHRISQNKLQKQFWHKFLKFVNKDSKELSSLYQLNSLLANFKANRPKISSLSGNDLKEELLKLKQNLLKITADHKESIEELFKITDNAQDLVNGQAVDLRKFGVFMMMLQNDLINKLVYKVNNKQGIPVIILREEIAAILGSNQQESKINIENKIKDFSVLSEETGVMFKNNKFILLPRYK